MRRYSETVKADERRRMSPPHRQRDVPKTPQCGTSGSPGISRYMIEVGSTQLLALMVSTMALRADLLINVARQNI